MSAEKTTGGAVGFTPGPWTLGRRSRDGGYQCINGERWDAFAEVVVRLTDDELDHPVGMANARLILSAPDLYEALVLAMGALEEATSILGGEYGDTYSVLCNQMLALEDKARVALAKATLSPSGPPRPLVLLACE